MGSPIWTLPADLAVGHVVTAAEWQSYVTNNLLALQLQYSKTTTKDVTGTIASTDLLNGEITIAGNVMGANGLLECWFFMDFMNNSGGAVNPPRLALKLGSTTLLDTGPAITNTLASSASRYGGVLYALIQNLGATNAQAAAMQGQFVQAQASAVGSSGIGISASGLEIDVAGSNATSLAVDTTASQALTLTTVNASNSASYSTRLLAAKVKVLPS